MIVLQKEADKDPDGVLSGDQLWRERAEYHTLFRNYGFDSAVYFRGIPSSGEIQFEDALNTVKAALLEEHGITDQTFESDFAMYPDFNVSVATQPKWEFVVFSVVGSDDSYYITIDGVSGEVISLIHSSESNG